MKSVLKTLATLLVVTAAGPAQAGDLHFLAEAVDVYQRTVTALEDCGLTLLDHEDARLPRPPVPADQAVVNRQGVVIAYTNYEATFATGAGNIIEFKSPNGGQAHSILFSSEAISYVTPFAGTIAITSRARTAAGWHFRFLCRSQYVDFATYGACVQAQFIDVVTAQLCR